MLVIAGFAEHLFGIWAASCAENDKAMLSVSISKQARRSNPPGHHGQYYTWRYWELLT